MHSTTVSENGVPKQSTDLYGKCIVGVIERKIKTLQNLYGMGLILYGTVIFLNQRQKLLAFFTTNSNDYQVTKSNFFTESRLKYFNQKQRRIQ